MATKENTSASLKNDVIESAMRIDALAESVQLMIDSDEMGAGNETNAKAFTLMNMIASESKRLAHYPDFSSLKGGAA